MERRSLICLALVAVIAVLLLLRGRASGGRPTITAFTQPWCGACKRLQPEWDRLKGLAGAELDVVQVNCSEDDCSAITRYPTIVCKGAQYAGERTAEAMRAWALGM